MNTMRGSSPSKNLVSEHPEHLIDVFKAAALSVTKLYKTSAAAQSKARIEGYQDCLDDLLAFLDKRNIGVSDGEGWQIRRWATERLDGRDGRDIISQANESDDENDKVETASSPGIHPSSSVTNLPSIRVETQQQQQQPPPPPQTESAPPTTSRSTPAPPITDAPPIFTAPTQDSFTFQSSHPYPQDAYLNIANLDLSDSRRANENPSQGNSTVSTSHSGRSRNNNKRGTRPPRSTTHHLGKGAGQKRSINLAEIWDVGNVGFGKDVFGRDGKRNRHT